jgi:hypothetical protein
MQRAERLVDGGAGLGEQRITARDPCPQDRGLSVLEVAAYADRLILNAILGRHRIVAQTLLDGQPGDEQDGDPAHDGELGSDADAGEPKHVGIPTFGERENGGLRATGACDRISTIGGARAPARSNEAQGSFAARLGGSCGVVLEGSVACGIARSTSRFHCPKIEDAAACRQP